MTILPCISVSIETLKKLMVTFSPEVTICIRGRHAVGKSEVTYQVAAMLRSDFYKNNDIEFEEATAIENQPIKRWVHRYEMGLPVIERRLSQLTEGDITGMPDLGQNRQVTQFKPCDWLITACRRPVVLFLDERNRALPGVKQAVFQLMDSRAFYGYKLHPETRIVVAENVGEHYTVEQNDPAEISRAATVELNPPAEEWLKYVSGIDWFPEIVSDFIRKSPEHLEFIPDNSKKVLESNKKYPDRRAWFKAARELVNSDLVKDLQNPLSYAMIASMVGVEAAQAFQNFAKNYSSQVSLEEIMTDWSKAKKKVGKHATPARYTELAKKLGNKIIDKDFKMTEAQAKNVAAFLIDAPSEPKMELFTTIQDHKPHLLMISKYCKDEIVNLVRQLPT